MRVKIAGLALLFALAGCDTFGIGYEELDGTWTGAMQVDGETIAVSMRLNENDEGEVLGSGTVGRLDVMVDGERDDDDVSLNLTAPTFDEAHYNADMDSDEKMRGEVRGSGFTGQMLILEKR